ncbi:MAG: response regulator, partial [Desulfonatronovibrio sp.]|nr:response regulator [Desulfovibrionales bacterium]
MNSFLKTDSRPAAEKILVVDDDPAALLFATSIIGKAGYTVYKAATGNEALSQIEHHQPDLVLLDVMLPDINGLEVCKTIKKDKLLKHIFVILFSALQTDSQHKALGLETGADGYLVKPVHQRELIAQIQAMLRLKRAEEKISRQKIWYETVLNSLQEVVVCVNADMSLIWGNESAMDSINTSLKSAMGQKCYDLWGCRKESLNDCPVVRSMKSGQTEHGLVRSDHGTIWDTRAYPVRNEQGYVINMLEVAMDVTQNIETRQALEQNEELLQEVT